VSRRDFGDRLSTTTAFAHLRHFLNKTELASGPVSG
jgi:hypothetical protein